MSDFSGGVDTASAPSPAELAAAHGLTISGRRPSLAAYTAQLWSRRHFIVAFATARLTAMYTAARLGQIWQVMTPLLNAAVYYLIFGLLLGTNRGIPNFIAYLCTGVFVFQFTQSAVLAGTRSIADNLGLIRALHFPRACLPIAFTVIQLQQLIFSMGVLGVIVLATGEPLTWRWLLIVPVLLLQSVFNAGLALFMARIGAKTTDMAQLMPFVLRTWMYLSGVFWAVSSFTADAPRWVATVLNLNPALIFNDLMRYALMESVTASLLPSHVWVIAAGWALLVGLAGYVFFWRAEEEYGRG
ncbi:ABC transporter permease [Streptacidiphilus sp. PB12-B1b]|uniref:ABC transporter permease n=1 Tax=Streptacidiphilus sp. PB12-B1b TaxID=2705012 RepID=UPI0015FCCD23|nr:ABC transporter permease [Streptacidiphilus sp. PB12-B1b]QMU76196.1 ABC transporter permease [Streptacidiphilus sp. PB12-B1b]